MSTVLFDIAIPVLRPGTACCSELEVRSRKPAADSWQLLTPWFLLPDSYAPRLSPAAYLPSDARTQFLFRSGARRPRHPSRMTRHPLHGQSPIASPPVAGKQSR